MDFTDEEIDEKKEELENIAKLVSKSSGVKLDEVKCRYDSLNMVFLLRGIKFVEGERHGFEERFTSEIYVEERNTPSIDTEDIQTRYIESRIQEMRQMLSESIEINGHEIVFYLEDGFSAYDKTTGKEWSFTAEDMRHHTPIQPPVEEDCPLPHCQTTILDDYEIPREVKEKMKMWVIGWALEFTPDEYFKYNNTISRVQKA